MPSPNDVVVDDLSNAPLFIFSIGTVEIIHQSAEHSGIGHLAGNSTGFHQAATQVFQKRFLQQLLDFADKIGSLIIKDIRFEIRLDLFMLGIATGGI